MEPADYQMAWIVYLIAAAGLSLLAWMFLRKYFWRDLAMLLQLWLMTLLFVPWYVFPDEKFMAPAFIVAIMDTITINREAGLRALTPLIMALVAAFFASLLLSVVYHIWKHKRGTSHRTPSRHTERREPHMSES